MQQPELLISVHCQLLRQVQKLDSTILEKFNFSTFNYNEKPMSYPLLQLLRDFKFYSWKHIFLKFVFYLISSNLIFECGIRHSDACNVTKLIVMSSYSACWYIKMFSIYDLEYIYQCTLLKSSRFNYQIHV